MYFISVAYLDERRLTGIFKILIFLADGGKGKYLVVAANAGVPAHDNMRLKHRAFANLNVAFYVTKWADPNSGANLCTFLDHSAWMNDCSFVNHRSNPCFS